MKRFKTYINEKEITPNSKKTKLDPLSDFMKNAYDGKAFGVPKGVGHDYSEYRVYKTKLKNVIDFFKGKDPKEKNNIEFSDETTFNGSFLPLTTEVDAKGKGKWYDNETIKWDEYLKSYIKKPVTISFTYRKTSPSNKSEFDFELAIGDHMFYGLTNNHSLHYPSQILSK